MDWTSILAIYVLFWVISAFIILPFGIRNHAETGVDMVQGQADGAPVNFRPGRVLLYTTLLATLAFVLFYFNYTNQWITVEDIDFFGSIERLAD
ncbi:DUF1467 family protein [Parasphingorhabdus cellanae]|uniref:DUF1467 family protein n=1 Tax=Parasphingorhabdus cellanae TaxID=2806553 RepID=A0ABX7T576_9SPHN|nr:DUF1467 family protein [Parasphingorhabdus cellanae]QTD56073.1 DUF1467 family protein [Parasphingorhabdus cellanae]